MTLSASKTTLFVFWCLILACVGSLSLRDVRPGMVHQYMKKWKEQNGLLRRGQKEVVEDYEVGNTGHLLQQLTTLKAILSERLKDYEGHKDQGPFWLKQKVKATNFVPNKLIEHRRKREINDDMQHNSLQVKGIQDNSSLNSTEHKVKKRANENDDKGIELVKEIEENINKIPDELVKDKTLFKDKEDYDNFFRNEYYRTLAQAFATTRKKRQTDESNNEFYELTGRLDSIEDALLSDVVDSIEANRGNQNTIKTIEIANDVENVRAALNHLKEILDKIDEREMRADNFELNEGISLKDQPKKVGNLPIVFRTHSNDQNARIWEDVSDDVVHLQPQNAGFRPLPGFSARPIPDGDLPLGKWKFFDEDNKEDECPTLFLLARDCSSLDVIPNEKLHNVLIKACKWLEICYACGQGYELQPDDCDTGFLYGVRSVCEGDVPCQATGRLLLLSLRQTGASRKSLQPMCHADRCVERFLRQPSS